MSFFFLILVVAQVALAKNETYRQAILDPQTRSSYEVELGKSACKWW